jgi:hypothetical protein
MAWTKNTTTKHTCGGPSFGRKTPGCPRCDELIAGAEPIAQPWRKRHTPPFVWEGCRKHDMCMIVCVCGDN